MPKLFSLEASEKTSGNELLIDKLLERNKQPDSPVSLTADLLKQREDVAKEVNEQIKADEEEEDKPEESSEENTDNNEEPKPSEEKDEEEKEDKETKEDTPPKEENTSKEDNDESAADDKDELSSLVGSGLNDSSTEKSKKEDPPKEKGEPATESYKPKATLANLFDPLRRQYDGYLVSLESFDLKEKAIPIEKQPIVYVKESILESIKNLTNVSFKYIENNTSFIKTISDSILKLNERITVLNALVDNEKYHFTHKLVKDKDIIANVSYKDHSDPRETARLLLKYIEDSNASVSMLMNNDFEEMKSAFLSRSFTEDGTDLIYEKPLPGFNSIKVALQPYNNYLKTKVENFQYYKLRSIKPEDLYSLSAISVTKDKDLEYIVKTLSNLLVSVTVAVDTLKGVNGNFATFTDELKVIAYNVSNDEYTNLTELGIDEKIKDFIKFKLAMEASYININMTIEYITSILSVLDVCLELSE